MDSETSTPGFWPPVVVSLVFTPVGLLLGFYSAGSGHGDYFFTKLLFPLVMLLSGAGELLPIPAAQVLFIGLAVVQYPVYGFILGFANQRDRFYAAWSGILVVHGVAALLLLAMPM
jgi:hypothetical protein